MNEDESMFDPEDMTELEGIFTQMIADNEDGFIVEFGISILSAKELVNLWNKANMGSRAAQKASWMEYSKIMGELKKALESKESDD